MSNLLTPWLLAATATLALITAPASAASYKQTNLVSDQPGLAPIVDANLKNPWGLALSATGGNLWVSNQATGTSTIYAGGVAGSPFTVNPLVVSIPWGGSPVGIVFSGNQDFTVTSGADSGPARFIFSSLSGVVSGWNPAVPSPAPSSNAQIGATTAGAVYTGLALDSSPGASRLYAADVVGNKIDVFDKNFAPVALAPGAFTVPGLPANLHIFNIQKLGGTLYATFENVTDPPAGGAVAAFDLNGNFLRKIVEGAPVSAPWGLALAPSNFGPLSNALLVGNNLGDNRINAFDPITGQLLGQVRDGNGNAIEIDGLWGLQFGNGISVGDTNTLIFSAGSTTELTGSWARLPWCPSRAEPSRAVDDCRHFAGRIQTRQVTQRFFRLACGVAQERSSIFIDAAAAKRGQVGLVTAGRTTDPTCHTHLRLTQLPA